MLTLSSHYKVRLDRQDVRFLDRRWYRRQIGIVHKKPEFFNTSVADNIAYGKGEATLKEIVRAAKVAGAHEFILTLPHVSETSYFQTFLWRRKYFTCSVRAWYKEIRRNELQAFGFGPAMFNHWARENDSELGNIQGSYVTCCLYSAEIGKEESVKALSKV